MQSVLIALLLGQISCLETNVIDGAENTHLYINEKGVLVDESVTKDKKNEMLIMDVPAHHDRVETRVIYDETPGAEFMMTIVPDRKSCEIMRKPSILNFEEDSFKSAKHDNSTPQQPIDLKSKKIGILEIDLETTIGPSIPHMSLPKKFQSHCPQDYTAYTAHVEVKSESSTFFGVELDDFDYVPETVEVTNHRTKRSTKSFTGCFDHNYNHLENCHTIIGVKCPHGMCSQKDKLYRCRRTGHGTSCWYHLVPCNLIRYYKDENYNWEKSFSGTASGHKLTATEEMECVAHVTNKNQQCEMCCRNQNCGTLMPQCKSEDEGPCMWANWGSWSECSTKCIPGIQTAKRIRTRNLSDSNPSGEDCNGEEEKEKVCNGTLSEDERNNLRRLGVYETVCTTT